MSNFPDRCHAWGAIPRWVLSRTTVSSKNGLSIRKLLLLLLLVTLSLGGTDSTARAQESIPTLITFTGFTGSGFSPTPTAGQLDSDSWKITGFDDGDLDFGGTKESGDYARGPSSGGVSTGGIYAFETGGDNIILGIQPTEVDFTPGSVILRLQNSTGASVTALSIEYDIFFLNNAGRANSLNFSYSSDDTTYTAVPSLDFTTPVASTGSVWQSVNRSVTLTGLNISNNAFYYLRWTGNDVSGGGSRDEYGLDNIRVTLNPIDIQGNGQLIFEGDTTPSTDDHTDFGAAVVDGGTVARTFTIHNIGAAALTVAPVTIAGANAGDFSVTTQPASSVAGNGTTTFVVTFDPIVVGERTATVSVVSNDSDETPYTFTIQGDGVESLVHPTLTQGPLAVAQLCTRAKDSTYPERSEEGTCNITFTLNNGSGFPVEVRYYRVNIITNDNWILNAEGGPARVGAIVLAPQTVGAATTFTPQFEMGLMSSARYTLRFSVFGYVGTSGASAAEDNSAAVELGTFGVELTPNLPSSNVRIFLPAVER